MENSYKYFKNEQCECFPCHKGIEDFNCLFCYCPFYFWDKCPGTPADFEGVKDCSGCVWPHKPENYEPAMKLFRSKANHKTFKATL